MRNGVSSETQLGLLTSNEICQHRLVFLSRTEDSGSFDRLDHLHCSYHREPACTRGAWRVVLGSL